MHTAEKSSNRLVSGSEGGVGRWGHCRIPAGGVCLSGYRCVAAGVKPKTTWESPWEVWDSCVLFLVVLGWYRTKNHWPLVKSY